MILENLTIKGINGEKQISIQSGRIKAICQIDENAGDVNSDTTIRFENAIAFPGLINSHDHLDFNLFPSLANRVYASYTEWANDIHQKDKKVIDEVLKIPQQLRTEWGCYKNLLNGFTTVMNHGRKIKTANDFITVFQDCYSLHSTAFEKKWKWELNNPLKTGKPFVMHIGEGTGDAAVKEISNVMKWNSLFNKKIIAVHGIAMSMKQAAAFYGLVWCPASNFFLTGQTPDVNELRKTVPVVFGTDSTLSSPWNAWEHFRQAKNKTSTSEDELLDMLTAAPAALWGLKDKGEIGENVIADIVVAQKKPDFFENNPEDILLVMRHGKIRLYDETIADQLPSLAGSYSRIIINNRIKFVEGNLPGLMKKVHSYYPGIVFPITA